jgi:hypothetical protein
MASHTQPRPKSFAEIIRETEHRERAKDAYEKTIQAMTQEVIEQREALIRGFLAGEQGETPLTLEDIAARGHFTPYTDGVLEFIWDGHPRLRFFPVKFVDVQGTMKPVQQFERVPVPVPVERIAEEQPGPEVLG